MGKAYDAIKKQIALATKETITERQDICRNCEFAKLGICTKCGCVIRYKTKFAQAKCPMGYW